MSNRIDVRQKGMTGERELCKYFNNLFQLPEEDKVLRNLEQTRFNSWTTAGEGYDIRIPVPNSQYVLYVECKRTQTISKTKFWDQITRATPSGEYNIPLVAYRKNRQPWRFLVSAEWIANFNFKQNHFIEMEKEVFEHFVLNL